VGAVPLVCAQHKAEDHVLGSSFIGECATSHASYLCHLSRKLLHC
jgi:hypothetical protein